MKVYQPQQHLSFVKVVSRSVASSKIPIQEAPKTYLRSTVSILANKGETYTRIAERDQFSIIYRATTDEKWATTHVFDDVVFINQGPESPKQDQDVKVIVYTIDGKVGGQVTSTISGNSTIEIE